MSDQDLWRGRGKSMDESPHEAMSASCADFRFHAESEPEVLSLS